jgi:hypothetical protein
MTESTRENLRVVFPRFPNNEVETIEEHLKRYVLLAIAVAAVEGQIGEVLTKPLAEGRVNAGLVDPGTFKNTG